jgi:hypothetical protein
MSARVLPRHSKEHYGTTLGYPGKTVVLVADVTRTPSEIMGCYSFLYEIQLAY